MISVPTGTLVKSTITSARSAGLIRSWLSWTGAGRKPPSVPICQKGMSLLIFRIRNRPLQPLRKRKRYRRCSTSRKGQLRPLTTIVFPKNSGFQMGDTSLSGM